MDELWQPVARMARPPVSPRGSPRRRRRCPSRSRGRRLDGRIRVAPSARPPALAGTRPPAPAGPGRRLWLGPGRRLAIGYWIGISQRLRHWRRGRGGPVRRRRCRCCALSSDRLRRGVLAAVTGWGVSHVVPQRRPDDFHAPLTAGPSGKLRARHHLVYPGGVDPRNLQLYVDPGRFRQLRPGHTAKVPGMAGPEAPRHRRADPGLPGAALSGRRPQLAAKRCDAAVGLVQFFAAGQAPGPAHYPTVPAADPEPGHAVPAADAQLDGARRLAEPDQRWPVRPMLALRG